MHPHQYAPYLARLTGEFGFLHRKHGPGATFISTGPAVPVGAVSLHPPSSPLLHVALGAFIFPRTIFLLIAASFSVGPPALAGDA